MDAKSMQEQLTKRAGELRESLMQLETEFNQKKEEFLKIQGALEAISVLDNSDSSSNATE